MAESTGRATRFYALTSNDDWMELTESGNAQHGSEVAVFVVDDATDDDLIEAAEYAEGPQSRGRLLGRLILQEGRPVFVDGLLL